MHTNYLTYQDYVSSGGQLAKGAFDRLEFQARKRLDYLTDSRIQSMSDVPAAVKMCVLSLISVNSAVGTEAQAEAPKATSFSTDGYSETYGNAISTADASARMDDLIRNYLWGETDDEGTPLLFRGVSGYASGR